MYASMNNLVFISQTSDLRNKTSRVEIVTGKIWVSQWLTVNPKKSNMWLALVRLSAGAKMLPVWL